MTTFRYDLLNALSYPKITSMKIIRAAYKCCNKRHDSIGLDLDLDFGFWIG